MARDCSPLYDPSNPWRFKNIQKEDFDLGTCVCHSDETGPEDVPGSYNCIAFAAGITDRWWWPNLDRRYFDWPEHLPRRVEGEESVDDFTKAFEHLKYEQCDSGEIEAGFEKVAIFAYADGSPTHACRSLPDGRWISKLGPCEDVIHSTLAAMEGESLHLGKKTGYGKAIVFLRRPYNAK